MSDTDATNTDMDPARTEVWPNLPYEEWQDTYDTLHMWAQVVGKIKLRLMPPINHWWQVALYVSPRGLTTSKIPYQNGSFEIELDFLDHQLLMSTSDGETRRLPLERKSVADFYSEYVATLRELDIAPRIYALPVEIADATPFREDRAHASYDADAAQRCWRVLSRLSVCAHAGPAAASAARTSRAATARRFMGRRRAAPSRARARRRARRGRSWRRRNPRSRAARRTPG